MLITLLILLSFTAIIPQTRFTTISSPSVNDFEEIFKRYPTTVMCRCSLVSIPYAQLISFNVQYHQVCSSDFVTEEWFSSLFNINTTSYYPLDFRLMAFAQFQVLSILCRTSRQVVKNALKEFLVTAIVSPNAWSRDILNIYLDLSIEQLQKNTLVNFLSYYHFVSSLFEEYRFISALRTNFYTSSVPGSNISETFSAIYPQENSRTQSSMMSNETCRCDHTSDCVYPAGIYNQTKSIIPNEVFSLDEPALFMVPGFQVGCVPQNALLQSTLECFYNQSCLDIVISLTGALRTVSTLNISKSFSRFSPTTSIGVLFDNLMIESWGNSTDFAAYFQSCAPKTCSYSYTRLFFLIYMITTLASVFGGLNVVLRIVSPLFVQFVLRLCLQRIRTVEANEEHERNKSFKDCIQNLIKLIRQKVITFNLFKTTFTDVQPGIYSTRVYIILLILGIFILILYSTSLVSSQQIIIRNPSIEQIEQLRDKYGSILSCPCRRSLIPRSTFTSYKLQIHPFCRSSFVRDDSWFQYWTMTFLNGTIDPTPPFYWIDFRKNGLKFFKYVKIFCDMVDISVSQIVNPFQEQYIYTPQPITQVEFNDTTYLWQNYLHLPMMPWGRNKLSAVEQYIQQSGSISSEFFYPPVVSKQKNNTWISEYGSGAIKLFDATTCDCTYGSYCFNPLGFYCYPPLCTPTDGIAFTSIYNLFIGCHLSYFSSSTVECFYNEPCVQMLINLRLYGYENVYLPIDLSNIKSLDQNDIAYSFSETSLRYLFLAAPDYFVYIGNYSSYYNQCQPETCTYTIDQKLNLIARVNLISGLIGGVTVVLRLLVPSFIKIIYLIYHLRYQQTQSMVIGCSTISGLLHSTFECFYDDVCINQLNAVLSSSFTKLNIDATQFPPTTPIESIVDDYPAVIWKLTGNYSAYFEACAPSKCQYHYIEQHNVVYIFATLLGLYGGLSAGLYIFVWHLLSLYRVISNRCSRLLQRVHPS
ncbi:unnamed protein product [Rotaria sp. Silwood2]|nr:unnamed protein product [Rotaria sp. Silwood2]